MFLNKVSFETDFLHQLCLVFYSLMGFKSIFYFFIDQEISPQNGKIKTVLVFLHELLQLNLISEVLLLAYD